MNRPLIRLTNIRKRFPGVQALGGVDLELEAGEIHCLVGENGSGKSTLIKILAGVERPDPGSRIEVDGRPVHRWRSAAAVGRGIEVIYQDLSLFPNLSVAENIALVQWVEARAWRVNRRRGRAIARQALKRVGAETDLDALVGRLPLADQQLVAIARALTSNVRLLVMDEPTTSLTRREIGRLFEAVRSLQSAGVTTLLVTHKLEEVAEIADRVTVLRDGEKVDTLPRCEATPGRLALLMSGHEPEAAAYRAPPPGDQPVLELVGLSRAGRYHDVSLRLFPGEIVGLAGLLGSGRRELAHAIFGLYPPEHGEIRIDGRVQRIRSVQDAIRLGIGLVPENRAVEGLVMPHSVGRNAVLAIADRLRNRWGLLPPRRLRTAMQETVRSVAVRSPSLDVPAETLSGGNQQRLVLGKWLATRPRVLVMLGPTVGVDVAAKSAIHETVRDLARGGVSILMISDETGELLACCNRILLMAGGRIRHEWQADAVSESEIRKRLLED